MARRASVAEAWRRNVLFDRAEQLSGIGSWEWSPAAGELLWSDQLYRLYGLEPGSITPSPGYVFEHVHPDDHERVVRAVERLERDGRLPPLEYRFVRPDGTIRQLRATMALIQESVDAERIVVGSVEDVTEKRRVEEEMAEHLREQRFQARLEEALATVAAAVARGDEARAIVDMVAECLAGVLDVPASAVVRFERGRDATVVAAEGLEDFVGEHIAVPASAAPTEAVNARVAAAGWPVVRSVPVGVGDELRGCLTVATSRDDELPVETDRSLVRFSALVATAVASADARARLQHLATTDGLTGLANHRAFQERLRDELEHARRRGSPLALAVFDVDGFKVINDQQGHQHGDDVLAAIGRVFAEHARGGDLPARIGGDELAIIAPDSDDCGAYGLAERLRAAVADLPFDVPLTMSAGVAYTEAGSEDPAELLRLADGALYWAKRNGRDMTVRYSPEVVRELSDAERARRHERVHAVQALRALARAVDAKDPSTREHSFRVAELAQALALRLGWDAERVIRLRDAAMLHDVGKIGVPDAVLFKPGRLDRDEYEQVKLHAPLGAQITEDILDAEQVGWVRGHHERLDGGGYPDGLAADDIPDGARLLAVADAYDSIVSPRPYKDEIPPAVAVERISEDAGRQFDPAAAEALADWLAERARAS